MKEHFKAVSQSLFRVYFNGITSTLQESCKHCCNILTWGYENFFEHGFSTLTVALTAAHVFWDMTRLRSGNTGSERNRN